MKLQPIQKLVVTARGDAPTSLDISWTSKALLRLFVDICAGALRFRAYPIIERVFEEQEEVDLGVADVLPNFSFSDVLEVGRAINELAVGDHIPTEEEVEQLLGLGWKTSGEAKP